MKGEQNSRPAPAMNRRYGKRHLPCWRPRRKREASTKSREVSNTGAEPIRLTSGQGAPASGGASSVSRVSRGWALPLPVPAGCLRRQCGIAVAVVEGRPFRCSAPCSQARRLRVVVGSGAWGATAQVGRGFFLAPWPRKPPRPPALSSSPNAPAPSGPAPPPQLLAVCSSPGVAVACLSPGRSEEPRGSYLVCLPFEVLPRCLPPSGPALLSGRSAFLSPLACAVVLGVLSLNFMPYFWDLCVWLLYGPFYPDCTFSNRCVLIFTLTCSVFP